MTDDQTLLDLAGRATIRAGISNGTLARAGMTEGDARFYAAANPERIIQLVEEKRREAARADLMGFMLAWVVAATRPTQPHRKPYVFHSLSACAGCGCSGDDFGSVNVEAFEMTGELYCDDCADEAIENASQGEGE